MVRCGWLITNFQKKPLRKQPGWKPTLRHRQFLGGGLIEVGLGGTRPVSHRALRRLSRRSFFAKLGGWLGQNPPQKKGECRSRKKQGFHDPFGSCLESKTNLWTCVWVCVWFFVCVSVWVGLGQKVWFTWTITLVHVNPLSNMWWEHRNKNMDWFWCTFVVS